MRILHICLASYYTEGMSYQDNLLPDQNIADGHEVTIISNASKYQDGEIVPTGAQDFHLDNSIRLVRMPYLSILGEYWGCKLRAVKGLYNLIDSINPDVILYHGTGGFALLPTVKYKKKHPSVKLYIDSHEDYNNSARNWVSKNIQHRLIHAPITRYACAYAEKILYISLEAKQFLTELYKIPDSKLEFYPLGGMVYSPERRKEIRVKKRAELGISDNDILLCHSGKMDKLKRTLDILKALSFVEADNLRLIIIGSLADETKESILSGIKADKRVQYVGWKSSDELMEYLCSCDLYVQPGGQSATMQNAICCGSPVMLYPHPSHEPYLKENGLYVKTVEDMIEALRKISDNPSILNSMSENSYKVAYELLDYKKLAARLYQ